VNTNTLKRIAALGFGISLAVALLTAASSIFGTSSGVPTPGADGTVLSADAASPGGMHWIAAPGGGDAFVANPLSQFAATTSAQLAGVISNETGTGLLVFNASPTLTTPTLGVATATSINGLTITSSTGTFTLTNLKTLAVTNTLTLSGTDSTVMTFPSTTGTVATLASTGAFTNKTITDATNVLGGVTMTLGSDAAGDTYYRDSFGVLHRLPIGTAAQVLTVSSGIPAWATNTGGGNVSSSGTPTATHVAVWTNATTIQDGGILPSFTPTGGIDEMIYYQGSGDSAFHPVTLANGHTLIAGALGLANLTLPTGDALRTSTSAGNTILLAAYDVDGASYTTFATLTANNTPTMDLAASVTLNGQSIANANNTIVFTNKTLNSESTGNVLEHPIEYQWTIAASQATVDSLAFNTQASGAATATHSGTTVIVPFVSFADATTNEIQLTVPIPTNWDSSATVEVFGKWRTTATANSVKWQVSGVCAADAEVIPTAYSSTADTVSDTAKGTTLQLNDFSITLSTSANHSLATCSGGEQFFVRFFRDNTDSLGAAAQLASLGIRFRVTK